MLQKDLKTGSRGLFPRRRDGPGCRRCPSGLVSQGSWPPVGVSDKGSLVAQLTGKSGASGMAGSECTVIFCLSLPASLPRLSPLSASEDECPLCRCSWGQWPPEVPTFYPPGNHYLWKRDLGKGGVMCCP